MRGVLLFGAIHDGYEMNTDNSRFTDEQLAVLVQRGDKEKFGILMGRYEQKLSRYGKKFLFSQNNVEDLVQEVFIKAYQNIQSFDPSQKFSPWVYRIGHNLFINELKKKMRNPLYFFDFDSFIPHPVYEDPAADEHDAKEVALLLKKGLKQLPPHYREIIILYYLEGLSYKEIADVLRIPPGTVGIRIKRAKDRLKKILPKDSIEFT